MRTRRRASALVVLLLVAAPRVAHACAVCFDPRDKNRVAFLATTAFLTALPLGMVAGLVGWLRRRSRLLRSPVPPPDSGPVPTP